MKSVQLKQIKLENYKKHTEIEKKMFPKTIISGRNRQGKSTLMDAYFDVLTGKIADGTLPSNVRRKEGDEEVDGVVVRELELVIDDVTTPIRKETKKGKTASTTKYIVDGFDYNQTKYKEFLEKIADAETIMMCSNANVFLNELRKSSATARSILERISGFSNTESDTEIAILTKGHSYEDVKKKLNKEKREWTKKVDECKTKIKTLQEQNTAGKEDLSEKREKLLDEYETTMKSKKELMDANKPYDELNREITELKKSRDAICTKATENARKQRDKVLQLINNRESKKFEEEENIKTLNGMIATMEEPDIIQKRVVELQNRYKELYAKEYDTTELNAIQNEEFDPQTAICPTCGQSVPENQIDGFKRKFESHKQERIAKENEKQNKFIADKEHELKEIIRQGNEEVERKKNVIENKAKFETSIKESEKNVESLTLEIKELREKVSDMILDVDLSDDVEYKAVVEEIKKKEQKIEKLATTNNTEKLNEIFEKIVSIEKDITSIDTEIKNNKEKEEQTAKQINEISKDMREYGQNQADIQAKLDTLKEYSIKKNKLLADAINPYFKHFQFEFLDYTADGEPIETCKMMVDGIDYFNGLNHSDQILCNIDLIQGLQEMNELNLPIWIDDAESINLDRLPDLKQQMILLKVSEDELKVEEFN